MTPPRGLSFKTYTEHMWHRTPAPWAGLSGSKHAGKHSGEH